MGKVKEKEICPRCKLDLSSAGGVVITPNPEGKSFCPVCGEELSKVKKPSEEP